MWWSRPAVRDLPRVCPWGCGEGGSEAGLSTWREHKGQEGGGPGAKGEGFQGTGIWSDLTGDHSQGRAAGGQPPVEGECRTLAG